MRSGFTLKMHDYIHRPEGKLWYNQQVFTEIAPKYGMVTRILSLGRDAVWKDRLVKDLPDIKEPACLDLACGTGDITFRLARRYPGGSITGLDITEQMLAYAIERNRFQNIRFVVGDMCNCSLPDSSFDIITGGYALRNAPDIHKSLAEIRRMLKPGGTAAFLDFSKPPGKTLQAIEHGVLKIWGGFWGLLLHRNPEVYGYIAASLQQFPDRCRLREYLADNGFGAIHARRYYCGIVESIRFTKVCL